MGRTISVEVYIVVFCIGCATAMIIIQQKERQRENERQAFWVAVSPTNDDNHAGHAVVLLLSHAVPCSCYAMQE